MTALPVDLVCLCPISGADSSADYVLIRRAVKETLSICKLLRCMSRRVRDTLFECACDIISSLASFYYATRRFPLEFMRTSEPNNERPTRTTNAPRNIPKSGHSILLLLLTFNMRIEKIFRLPFAKCQSNFFFFNFRSFENNRVSDSIIRIYFYNFMYKKRSPLTLKRNVCKLTFEICFS